MVHSYFKAYSLLEIILITTFLSIFVFVLNPGTYVDRFSHMLVKMNLLGQTELVQNKFFSMGFSNCQKVGVLTNQFSYAVDGGLFSLLYSSGELSVTNQHGQSAILFRGIDDSASNGFRYLNRYYNDSGIPSDVVIIDYSFISTNLDYELKRFSSNTNTIVLNEY